MKVFFGWTQNNAVAYIRMIQFAKQMQRMKGIEAAYSKWQPYDNITVSWQNELENPLVLKQLEILLENADITIFGAFCNARALALIQAAQEKYKKPIFMEMDDYIFNLPEYNVASNVYHSGSTPEWIFIKQMQISDGMIVSTNYLKEEYAKYNKNIHVIPNGIDFKVWDKLKCPTKNDGIIRIGFEGSPNHKGDLRILKYVLIEILKKYPNVEFHTMGCETGFTHERVKPSDDFKPVNEYPKALAEKGFDIGVAPLKDNYFNRGKSNLRYLEMSALRIPTAATDCRAYAEIENGVNGFKCSTTKEWIDSLSFLIENEKKRKEIGNNAYIYAKNNYALTNITDRYVELLKSQKR